MIGGFALAVFGAADGQGQFQIVAEAVPGHGLAQAAGQIAGAMEIGVGADDQELLAAPAARDVGQAHHVLDDACQIHQHLVAGLVAVAVVDPLEVVQIQQQQGQRGVVPIPQAHVSPDLFHQIAAVGQPGQFVGARQLVHLIQQFFQFPGGAVDEIGVGLGLGGHAGGGQGQGQGLVVNGPIRVLGQGHQGQGVVEEQVGVVGVEELAIGEETGGGRDLLEDPGLVADQFRHQGLAGHAGVTQDGLVVVVAQALDQFGGTVEQGIGVADGEPDLVAGPEVAHEHHAAVVVHAGAAAGQFHAAPFHHQRELHAEHRNEFGGLVAEIVAIGVDGRAAVEFDEQVATGTVHGQGAAEGHPVHAVEGLHLQPGVVQGHGHGALGQDRVAVEDPGVIETQVLAGQPAGQRHVRQHVAHAQHEVLAIGVQAGGEGDDQHGRFVPGLDLPGQLLAEGEAVRVVPGLHHAGQAGLLELQEADDDAFLEQLAIGDFPAGGGAEDGGLRETLAQRRVEFPDEVILEIAAEDLDEQLRTVLDGLRPAEGIQFRRVPIVMIEQSHAFPRGCLQA